MHTKINKKININGFIAVTATILISISILTFIVTVFRSSIMYEDMTNRLEWRTQANINANSCISTIGIMAVKDYFLNGEVHINEFGCTAYVDRDQFSKILNVTANAVFNGVHSQFFYQKFIIP